MPSQTSSSPQATPASQVTGTTGVHPGWQNPVPSLPPESLSGDLPGGPEVKLTLCTSNGGGAGSTPGRGTKIWQTPAPAALPGLQHLHVDPESQRFYSFPAFRGAGSLRPRPRPARKPHDEAAPSHTKLPHEVICAPPPPPGQEPGHGPQTAFVGGPPSGRLRVWDSADQPGGDTGVTVRGAHGTHTAQPRAQGTSTLTGHKGAGRHPISCSHWVEQNWESSCPTVSRLGLLTRPPSHLACSQLRSEPGVLGSLRQAPASVHGPSAESTLLPNDKHILQRKLVLSSTATQTTAAPPTLAPEGARHQRPALGQAEQPGQAGGRHPGLTPCRCGSSPFFRAASPPCRCSGNALPAVGF